jgi:hypothetical protein
VIIHYKNTFASHIAEQETIWIAINGKVLTKLPLVETIASNAETMRLIAPSFVKTGNSFVLRVVSLDEYGNLSTTSFKNKNLKFLHGEEVQKCVSFVGKKEITLQINEAGIFRYRIDDYVSNPIVVDSKAISLFWGDLHAHSKLSHDGYGAKPYEYAQKVSGLDFVSATEHWQSLGNAGYVTLKEMNDTYNQPGIFVTFPSDERTPKIPGGHHNIYFMHSDSLLAHKKLKESEKPALEMEELDKLNPEEVMLIPHHTGIQFYNHVEGEIGEAIDWNRWQDKGLRPLVEIFSHHGQSELFSPQHFLSYEYNRLRLPEKRSNSSVPGQYYAQDYWMQGYRPGVIASSDNHSAQPGQTKQGIAAVFSDTLTRKELFKSMRQRYCYGTTGERIIIKFYVDSSHMGQSIIKATKEMVSIKGYVYGTADLIRVELLRYRFGVDKEFNTIFSSFPGAEKMDFSFSIGDTITASTMYYIRVVQKPLEWPDMAWSSPIWVDIKK